MGGLRRRQLELAAGTAVLIADFRTTVTPPLESALPFASPAGVCPALTLTAGSDDEEIDEGAAGPPGLPSQPRQPETMTSASSR
jgi:hypothetical protein